MTNHIITIPNDHLHTVTGGAEPTAIESFAADNAATTKNRLRLVQQGKLDREDFNFLADNQLRAARVIADAQAARR